MRKLTIGNLFTHSENRKARYVLCEIDLNREVFVAYCCRGGAMVEFHFADASKFKVVKPGKLDSILS